MVRDGVTWFGPQTANVTVTVVSAAPQVAPTCSSVAPSVTTTNATTGSLRVYAYGVSNATSVFFPTWGDTGGQDDIGWYQGINNPEFGTFNTHVHMHNAAYSYVWCGATNWTRTAPTPAANFLGKRINYGGSNHMFYASGSADGFNTNNNWYFPNLNVRPIVGTYEHNPALVQSQMAAARASGQATYVLPIWTISLTASEGDGLIDGVYGEAINYEATGLSLQHQSNLRAVVGHANQLGFKRMIIRFNHYDGPWGWATWDEARYQKMWNYVYNTRNFVTSYRNSLGSSMELIYDLGGELGGVSLGQGQQFVTKLWSDYIGQFGNSDTLGFSFAYAPGRFAAQKSWYGSTLPKFWAFDIYPGSSASDSGPTMSANLSSIQAEMGALRNQPIIILETYFNDAGVRGGVQAAISGNRLLNIDTLVQWPTTYSTTPGTVMHFSPSIISSLGNSSTVFSNYASLLGSRVVKYSSTNADVVAIADDSCSTTASIQCGVTLVLGAPPSGMLNVLYVTPLGGITTLVACRGAGDQPIPWITQGTSYTFSVYQTASCTSAPPPGVASGISTLSL
jgi:hypothetical protein